MGLLTPVIGVRHALRRHHIAFGRSLVFRDLRAGSSAMARLRDVPAKVDVASVENSRDYVVNGGRITGQVVLPVWLHTISLGRGVAATSFLPAEQTYVADLGGWDRHLRTTHHHILRGESPEIDQVRQRVIDFIADDGPIWSARQAPIDRLSSESRFGKRRSTILSTVRRNLDPRSMLDERNSRPCPELG
jgi:hypothetical protein